MKYVSVLALVGLLLLPATAGAYNLLYLHGNPVRIHGDAADGISRLTWYDDPVEGAYPLTLSASHDSMQNAFDGWQNVPCSTVQFTYGGPGAVGDRGYNPSNPTMLTFEDPFDDLSGGVLAATATYDENVTEQKNGLTFRNIYGFDIVFGDGWNWIQYQDALGNCANQHVLESIALHEMGHGIGYAHSCEAGESCPDPDEADAVMYWAIAACDTSKAFPKTDDLAMHNLVYGPNSMTGFSADNTRDGLPMGVNFLVSTFADATNLSAVWDFGDGNNDTTAGDANHTYQDEGLYNVSLELSGTSATCGGDFTHKVLQRDLVLACGLSETSFNYSVHDKTVQFTGTATGQQIGCVDALDWDFGDGSDLVHTRSPQHSYSKDGTYQVSLTADGPGGTSVPFVQAVKIDTGGCKCSLSSSRPGPLLPGAVTLALLLGGIACFRRRRLL